MKLTAIGIKKSGPCKLHDGAGLELRRTEAGGRWVYRYSYGGKRREMGLGTYPLISLADARKERDRWAAALALGKDPISERTGIKQAAVDAANQKDPTLQELAEIVLDAKKAGLRGGGKNGRWMSPLASHVFPRLGRKPISTVTQTDLRDTLRIIWKDKHPTAEKAMQRLSIIFRQGKLMGYECDPFTVEIAKHMLGEVAHEVRPIVATAWQDIPALYESLNPASPVEACLRFMILTVVRSAGCRGAMFSEIDEDVWTVPAARMKGTVSKVREFRAPLSPAALELIEFRAKFGGAFPFAAHRGLPVSDTSLAKVLNVKGEAGRPHGFRTSFRTWVQDTNAASFDVAETALAHTIGSKVERSYARSDLLDQRRILMQKWSDFVTGQESTVVKFRGG